MKKHALTSALILMLAALISYLALNSAHYGRKVIPWTKDGYLLCTYDGGGGLESFYLLRDPADSESGFLAQAERFLEKYGVISAINGCGEVYLLVPSAEIRYAEYPENGFVPNGNSDGTAPLMAQAVLRISVPDGAEDFGDCTYEYINTTLLSGGKK